MPCPLETSSAHLSGRGGSWEPDWWSSWDSGRSLGGGCLDVGVHTASLLASTFQGLWESMLLGLSSELCLRKLATSPFWHHCVPDLCPGVQGALFPAGWGAHEPQVPFLRIL